MIGSRARRPWMPLAAVLALLATALPAIATGGPARAQDAAGEGAAADATPRPAAAAAPSAGAAAKTVQNLEPVAEGRLAHVHAGTCEELGIVVYPLAGLRSYRVEPAREGELPPVEAIVGTAQVGLADLFDEPFSLHVHESATNKQNHVACAEVGGRPATPWAEGDGLALRLVEQGDSGYAGIAWLRPGTDGGTAVTLYLAGPQADRATEAPLDLAALALTPDDLEAIGLAGFGLGGASYYASPHDYAPRVAGELGRDPAEVGDALAGFGWRRRYTVTLDRPLAPGTDDNERGVTSSLTEFATAEGAAAGFAFLEAEVAPRPGGRAAPRDLPLARPFGDQAELTRLDGAESGQRFQGLELTFRVGNLHGRVTLHEYAGQEPDRATVDMLAEGLLTKLRGAPSLPAPGLSNVALRLRLGGAVATGGDFYLRLDGRTFPRFNEPAAVLAARAAAYAGAADVYRASARIQVGDEASDDDVRYATVLYRFANAEAASGWLRGAAEHLAQTPEVGGGRPLPYLDVEPVAEAPNVGEEAVALAYGLARGEVTLRGHAVLIRVGAVVAQVQMAAVPGAPLAAVAALTRDQVACLEAGGLCAPVPAPAP